jgi:sugar phosphate isomerase/epimerase
VRTTIWVCALLWLLSSCASAPPPPTWSGPPPAQLVAEIRAAGKPASGELDVQPLREPAVEDLRAQAAQFERMQRYADAATALDKALAITPGDPAVMQERAETAVLLQDLRAAQDLATRAFEAGAKVGPLCRRHWSTVAVVEAERARQTQRQSELSKREEDRARFGEEARAATAAAATAQQRREACTLTGPPRY